MGITMIGHRLAILQCASRRTAPPAQPTTVTKAKASVNAQLSTLTLEMTRPQYRKFQQDWIVYKQITSLQPSQATAYLYTACNEEVKTSLINTHPGFLSEDETTALKLIEEIVTVRSNPAVHRKAFAELIQEENQSVKTFVVRLRSAATDCAFQCPGCEYDLSSINIKDQLIRGLNNSKLQAEVLAKTNQLKTLDDVVSYAESFETALRDQSDLANNNQASDTLFKFSHYKKKKQTVKPPPPPPPHHLKEHNTRAMAVAISFMGKNAPLNALNGAKTVSLVVNQTIQHRFAVKNSWKWYVSSNWFPMIHPPDDYPMSPRTKTLKKLNRSLLSLPSNTIHPLIHTHQ